MSRVTCGVCGHTARASRHRCRFEVCCSCWRGRPCRQRGQVLVEFAIVAPLLLALLLGGAELGLALLHSLAAQNAATTIAAVPEAEAAELGRLGLACTCTTTEGDGVRVVQLACDNPWPLLSGLLAPTFTVTASAPLPAESPAP